MAVNPWFLARHKTEIVSIIAAMDSAFVHPKLDPVYMTRNPISDNMTIILSWFRTHQNPICYYTEQSWFNTVHSGSYGSKELIIG